MTNKFKLIAVNRINEAEEVARFRTHIEGYQCGQLLLSMAKGAGVNYFLEYKGKSGLIKQQIETDASLEMNRISIQICQRHLSWENTPVTFHDVRGAGNVAQAISDAVNLPVRMTFITSHSSTTDVSRNNGAYIYPKPLVIRQEEIVNS